MTFGVPISHDCVVVPAWSLLLVFLAGLAAGAGACWVVLRRRDSAVPEEPSPSKPVEARQPAPEPEPAPVAAEPSAQDIESLGAGVDDLVAELERRYRGRKAESEPDTPGETSQQL